jgi:hypothetical protein
MKIIFLSYLFASLAAFAGSAAQTSLEIYPAPAGLAAAKDIEVKINGQATFVYDSPVGAFVCFGSAGPVKVEIRFAELDVKRVEIRPLKHGLSPTLSGSSVTFEMPAFVNLSVEFNGDLRRPLFIFANPIQERKPEPTAPHVRYFRAGSVYTVGEVELGNDEEVYIEGGAVVKGSFRCDNARHVVIRGPGIIDGSGVRGDEDYRVAVKNYRHWRKLVHFVDSEHVRIEGVILLNSNTWNVVPDRSSHVVIDNVKIICGNPSDDGIDILQSTNVTIRNCFIRSKDDCIAIKSLFETHPEKHTNQVVVENCVLWSAEWGNAFEIGFETLSPVIEDIVFRNCSVIHEEGGAVFSIHNSDYATVRNVRYENIVVEDARDKLIDFAIFVSLFSKDNPYEIDEFRQKHYLRGVWSNVLKIPRGKEKSFSSARGQIENITLDGIRVHGAFPFSVINGFDEDHMINGVLIKDLEVNGRAIKRVEDAKLHVEFTEGIRFQ